MWKLWEGWLANRAQQGGDVSGAARTLPVLALTLAWSVLALGAQHLPVLVLAAAGATCSALLALRNEKRRIDRAALLLFALGAWSLAQACPLPIAVVRHIAPKNAEIWSRAFELTGGASKWVSISLDPGNSIIEALKWTSYGAAAIAGGLVARQLGLRFIAGLTFLLGILVAVTTLLHGLLHAHALYGIYTPSFDPGPWGFGPIINPNNRAGYLNLSAFAGLALLVSRSRRGRRWHIALGVGGLIAVSVLARSRGGLLALMLGSLVLMASLGRKVMTRNGHRRRFYLIAALPPLIALVGGVTLAALGSDGNTLTTMRNEGLSKVSVIWWSHKMISDFPLFGVGRGALETVFPAYNHIGENQIHHHIENFVMDWVIEWGAVVALPALSAFALLLLPSPNEQPSKSVLRLALGVLLLQNLVDHGLEMPAVGLLAATVIAGLSTGARENIGAQRPALLGLRRGALSLAAVVLATAALTLGRHSAYDDRRRLSEASRQLPPGDVVDAQMLLDEIRTSVRRHPGDAFLPLLGAITARHVPGARPIQWLNWALERDMASGHAHLTAAYFLLRVHAIRQALDELRIASEHNRSASQQAAEWAVLFAPTLEDALRAVPDGPHGVDMLLSFSRHPRFRSDRLDLVEEATGRDPTSMRAQTSAAGAFLDAFEDANGSTCHFAQQPICIEYANRHILAIAHLEPESSLATELTARLLAATGRAQEARVLLSSTCGSFAKPVTCWQARIELGGNQISDAPLKDALQAYHTASCTNDDACIRASMWLARVLELRGDNMGALEYYGRAARAGGDSQETWLAIARVARAVGQPKRANDALERAQLSTTDPDLRRQLERTKLNTLADDLSDSLPTK